MMLHMQWDLFRLLMMPDPGAEVENLSSLQPLTSDLPHIYLYPARVGRK